jgi:alpha-methylacyl-CoA racemase
VYETKDGKFVSIGSLERQFYEVLLDKLGLADDPSVPRQHDKSQWPAMKERFAEIFRTKTRDEWCEIFEGTDACFAPVLSMGEAPDHPHNQHRQTFVERNGVVQPSPAPRFSRTTAEIQRPPAFPGQHTDEILEDWGFDSDDIAKLRASGSIA